MAGHEAPPKREEGAFKPKIIGILCNWCSYAGADLAGGGRIQYPPDVRVVRVMCTGRIDPLFIMKAFTDGADGVLIQAAISVTATTSKETTRLQRDCSL